MTARWHQCSTMTPQMLARASFSAVCLTVFPFEFRPWTFTIGFYGKNSIISELMILECSFPLTRSLPRDVYIRRQNDHPGGQGRIYTSHLNFVSTHLSKPGHRRGCCCMSPRCLLRQFVDHCLLFLAFFIEKTVLLCFARFLSKWRETALWLFPDATSWYELYV